MNINFKCVPNNLFSGFNAPSLERQSSFKFTGWHRKDIFFIIWTIKRKGETAGNLI